MKELARNLRKNQTVAESMLWFSVRQRRFCKFKFRRQHVIGPYIVDFVCLKQKLIIEVDGSQHLYNQQYDESRTTYLNREGFRVLRFWNNEVLSQINVVLDAIYDVLLNPSSALRAPSPQQAGEKE